MHARLTSKLAPAAWLVALVLQFAAISDAAASEHAYLQKIKPLLR